MQAKRVVNSCMTTPKPLSLKWTVFTIVLVNVHQHQAEVGKVFDRLLTPGACRVGKTSGWRLDTESVACSVDSSTEMRSPQIALNQSNARAELNEQLDPGGELLGRALEVDKRLHY